MGTRAKPRDDRALEMWRKLFSPKLAAVDAGKGERHLSCLVEHPTLHLPDTDPLQKE